jgi:hypothetical protein
LEYCCCRFYLKHREILSLLWIAWEKGKWNGLCLVVVVMVEREREREMEWEKSDFLLYASTY